MKSRYIAIALIVAPWAAAAQTNTFPTSGNVGIGTLSPGEKLSITGSAVKPIIGVNTSHTLLYPDYDGANWNQQNTALEINASAGLLNGNGNGSAWLVLSNSGGTGANINPGVIAFAVPGTSGAEKRVATIYTTLTANSASSVTGDLAFATSNAGTLTERLKITAAGNVTVGSTAITPSGNIGIGTTAPGEKLSVYGAAVKPIIGVSTSHTLLYPDYDGANWNQQNTALEIQASAPEVSGVGNGAAWLVLSNSASTNSGLNPGVIAFAVPGTSGGEKRVATIGTTLTANSSSSVTGCLQFSTANAGTIAERMRITAAGNVGIGTSSPGYPLAVNGAVRATQFIADVNTYADHVFAADYKLTTLPEVEKFIQRERHLPDIPSEAEARRDGIDVAQMQVKLLQKVEELTLHMIAHERKLSAQGEEIQKLRAENNALRERLIASE